LKIDHIARCRDLAFVDGVRDLESCKGGLTPGLSARKPRRPILMTIQTCRRMRFPGVSGRCPAANAAGTCESNPQQGGTNSLSVQTKQRLPAVEFTESLGASRPRSDIHGFEIAAAKPTVAAAPAAA
jgi:hypothetical protein